ncbi:uncharacterized protein [Lepeophtheirus salmonis]|uniref:Glutathione S-transferase DHAR1, mitochondrial n=2 Tax=Lepeophtheirus salmonis TaxID=72036 RepID=D3PI37_LEPSM|nr:glutathione S-transferase DHAR2-like [Lepeophtheirus salmonis]ADD38223.1 Glutathione S-transferase DHAR1, mitochondrial [Lepeophtheirus salmonis]
MTIELYLKAGHKGNDVGDCPFAQFIRCILNHKDISYDLKPCTQETKPEWLLKDFEGRLPCLMHNGKGTIESSDIADYIEKTFPQKSLKTPEEVSKEVLVFFPAMVKLCKSIPEDTELEKKFLDQCQVLEDLLTSSGGPYLSGASETLADYSLAPKLFHMTAIVPEFHPKVYEKLKQSFPKLNAYMTTMFDHKHFCSTTYDKQWVIEAWKVKRAL